MLELTGNNLGIRQQELNTKVREAFDNKIDFDKIKHTEEKSDVDRLFKIDLAVAYRNIDYIVDTLKCGDSLYISRVLKCSWLYDNGLKHVINPDYLHQNIFPFMSMKMKKKTLAAIASNTKDAQKAHDFYTYCLSVQINNIAWDFLVKTSDTVKRKYVDTDVCLDDSVKFEQFFGNSFDLIEFYLERKKTSVQNVDSDIFRFRYLYTFSDVKYLSLIEAYTTPTLNTNFNSKERFGLRISKNIMVYHKSRVLEKPFLYLNKLNIKIIVKYSSSEEAKIYLVALLPDIVSQFWSIDYYSTHKDFFQLLPAKEIYSFLKQIFTTKYPNELFEMDVNFYNLRYYDMLTIEQKIAWALKHLARKKEVLGPGQDFLWYQFVEFDKAFSEIKKCIYVTKCPVKRFEMFRVLIHAGLNQNDLEKFLTYYYEIHVNEDYFRNEKLIDEIIQIKNIFQFNEKCWNSMYKLLLPVIAPNRQIHDNYIILAIVYNIIHKKEIPKILMPHCERLFSGHRSSLFTLYYKNLNPDQHKLIYQWFMKYFEDKFKEIMKRIRDNDMITTGSNGYIGKVLSFMDEYKKTKDDCPDIVMDCIKLNWDIHRNYKWFQTKVMSEGLLLRLLKKDKLSLVNKLPELKEHIKKTYGIFRINKLLQKIKTYFLNDVAKSFQTFFEEWLTNKKELIWDRCCNQIVLSLFLLTDENYKIDLMSRYAPINAKIHLEIIDIEILQIQKAICWFACYSRPPVPSPKMLEYLKGDYVHYCMPMFSYYIVTLPMPQSLKFIEALLNATVSIQKHGFRLAFVCYDPENLQQLILDVWKKSKDVSLRALIYKLLVNKIKKDNTSAQSNLYAVLKILTSNLNGDDQDDIFDLLESSPLPCRFIGDYLATAWMIVRTLPEGYKNNNRRARVMKSIRSRIEDVDREFCRTQIIDEHIQTQFSDKENLRVFKNNDYSDLIDEKWSVTAKYITHFREGESNSSIEVLQLIMNKCLEMWDEIRANKYVARTFLYAFIHNLMCLTDNEKHGERKLNIVLVYKQILEFVKKSWPLERMYIVTWEIKLAIIAVTSIGIGKSNFNKTAITYDHLSSTEVASKFAKEIFDFIKDLLNERQFYSSFYSTIEKAIIDTTQLMTTWTNLDNHVLLCEVSCALTKFQLFETNMLALRILPELSSNRYTYYSNVALAIKEYNNYELSAYMYHKFVYPDYVKSPFT